MSTTMNQGCCCGQRQCAYLKHNSEVIEGLEKDLRGAAQIGQVRPIWSQLGCSGYSE